MTRSTASSPSTATRRLLASFDLPSPSKLDRAVASPQSPTTVLSDIASSRSDLQARAPRSPMWSPRRTTKLQGKALTTALGFVQRDLALQRSSSSVNVSTAEAWLEDMLELIEIEGGVAARGMEGAHGLRRARIDRRELAAAGLSPAQVARL